MRYTKWIQKRGDVVIKNKIMNGVILQKAINWNNKYCDKEILE